MAFLPDEKHRWTVRPDLLRNNQLFDVSAELRGEFATRRQAVVTLARFGGSRRVLRGLLQFGLFASENASIRGRGNQCILLAVGVRRAVNYIVGMAKGTEPDELLHWEIGH